MSTHLASGGPSTTDCVRAADRIAQRFPHLQVDVRYLGLADELADEPAGGSIVGPPGSGAGVAVPVRLSGNAAVVGPVPRPGRLGQPCVTCLGRRWQALRPNEERQALERRGGGRVHLTAPNPYLSDFALDALAELAAIAVADQSAPAGAKDGHGWVWTLALDTLEVTPFPLIADSDCPTCGVPDPPGTARGALRLERRPKRAVDEYHLVPVQDYGLDAEAYANPVCGALGYGAFPAFESPTTSPVTGAMRMRGAFGYHEFFWSGHADRFEDSKYLAILEGLERYAGLRPNRTAERIVGSWAELRDDALDPRDCGVYAPEYYTENSFHRPFREEAPLRWVWGRSLRDERPILVPEQLVHYGSGVLNGHETFVMECSNGCATGSCVEEATLYGLLELIERDAFLLCWYGRARLPEIDPATCTSTDTRIMIALMDHAGYEVRLFDNRIDLPIPVVTAVAVRRDGGLGTLSFAAGAGLDPEDAVRGALCEIASYIPGFDDRVRDDLRLAEEMAEDFYRVHELSHHSLLYGLPQMARYADFLLDGPRTMRSMTETYADWEATRPRRLDLLDDIHDVRDLLVARGFDVIVVDQTCREQRAEGLATVCVVVPGLLPIDFGWDRQRARHLDRTRTAFRDAPGWGRELDAGELNTAPHPFP